MAERAIWAKTTPMIINRTPPISENATAVSLTLPLTANKYRAKTLFPFFDGLIPEGWLLDIVTHNWKISPSDRFGVLLVACKDAVGNVSVRGEKL